MGQKTIVIADAAIMPQGSSAVNVPATMKKQNVAMVGIRKPVPTSLMTLDYPS